MVNCVYNTWKDLKGDDVFRTIEEDFLDSQMMVNLHSCNFILLGLEIKNNFRESLVLGIQN